MHRRLFERFHHVISGSVNGTSLAMFRICFGLAMAWAMFKYVWPMGDSNLATLAFDSAGWHFTYSGFSWVKPLPQPWLDWHFIITGVAGLLLAAGLFYRAAAVTVFIGYTWYFLLELAYFNNHYYLISLLAFLLIWMPADRCWALRWPRQPSDGRVPFWCVFLLRAQFLIVYVYASLAKFNADWLTGTPIIATGQTILETVESWLPVPNAVEAIHVSLALAWLGLVFDLVIGFLLLLPRTRLLAVAMLGIFHGINELTLPIGVFPFLGFTGSLIFLDPSWPVQLGQWLRSPKWVRPDLAWCKWGAIAIPGLGALLGWRLPDDETNQDKTWRPARLVTGLVAAWLAFQIVMPLRHFVIPGDASWTEEGQLFAWRMMLRQKASGHLTLHLEDEGLFQRTEQGRLMVDWSNAPAVSARGIYIPVDGLRFRWSDHPGLSTVYEGLVGYRTVFIPRSNNEQELTQLAQYWAKTTGREIQVRKAVSLQTALTRVGEILSEQPRSAQAEGPVNVPLLVPEALKILKEMPERGDRREEAFSMLNNLLMLMNDHDPQGVLARELKQVHPFELAGAVPSDAPLYLVDQVATPEELQTVSQSLGNSDSYIIWCDFTRLRPGAWKQLPSWFPIHEEGRLKILWNYFPELSLQQTEWLAGQPYMLRQYAREIARRWEEDCGRRPEVRAYTYVMMNYRYPHPLVDDEVDMASVEYSHWKHNDWILPMKERKVDIAEQVENGRAARR